MPSTCDGFVADTGEPGIISQVGGPLFRESQVKRSKRPAQPIQEPSEASLPEPTLTPEQETALAVQSVVAGRALGRAVMQAKRAKALEAQKAAGERRVMERIAQHLLNEQQAIDEKLGDSLEQIVASLNSQRSKLEAQLVAQPPKASPTPVQKAALAALEEIRKLARTMH